MKSVMSSLRDDQLERKLQLYLGSKKDWIPAYADWCADNSVSDGEQYDDHHINIFVKQQRQARAA